MNLLRSTLVLLGAAFSLPALSINATDYLQRELGAAKLENPAFGADAARGAKFFNTAHGSDWSCASCHTRDPRQAGKHASTGKPISAMAPAVTPTRFTDFAKSDKWFKRNCNDVVARECTSAERADVLAYLLSL
jgi:mono/diheme cytochrome c family protein